MLKRIPTVVLAMTRRDFWSFGRAFWTSFAALALVQFWAFRHQMNPDGISYIAIAETGAVNSYWSPLYSWCMSVWMRIFSVPPTAEFPWVHAMNLAILGFTALCFELFLTRWLVACALPARQHGFVRIFSYAAFAWSALLHTPITLVTPDLLASGFFYLALTLFLAVLHRATLPAQVALGSVLGAAYLSKSAMFPVALSFYVVLFFKTRSFRGTLANLAGVAAFLLTLLPHVSAISQREGGWTLGTSGRANYVWFVQNTPAPPSASNPDMVFLESDIPIAFPFHFEPSATERIRFKGIRQLEVVSKNLLGLAAIAVPFFVPLMALAFTGRPGSGSGFRRESILLAPSIVGILLYVLIVLEGRYIGAFATSLGIILFTALADRSENESIVSHNLLISWLLLSCLLLFVTLLPTARALRQDAPPYVRFARSASSERKLLPGEKVAYVGKDVYQQYWAHLGRVQIAAYAGLESPMMGHPQSCVEKLRERGIKAVVTDGKPPVPGSWRDWGNGYYGMRLDE